MSGTGVRQENPRSVVDNENISCDIGFWSGTKIHGIENGQPADSAKVCYNIAFLTIVLGQKQSYKLLIRSTVIHPYLYLTECVPVQSHWVHTHFSSFYELKQTKEDSYLACKTKPKVLPSYCTFSFYAYQRSTSKIKGPFPCCLCHLCLLDSLKFQPGICLAVSRARPISLLPVLTNSPYCSYSFPI